MKSFLTISLIELYIHLSFLMTTVTASGATFLGYDEDGVMKTACNGGGTLVFEPAENENGVGKICWQLDGTKVCEIVDIEPFIGNFSVTMECSAKSARVEIPVSGNYPVFNEYRFENRKGKLVSLGAKKDNNANEAGKIDFKSGIAQLRAGQIEKGFGLLMNANKDSCMGVGCRPTVELEKEQNLILAKRVGVEVGKIATKLHRSEETQKLNSLYEGYFKFCYDLNLFPKNQESLLINRLRDDATKEFILPLNDWAFYLWKQKKYTEAQILLETVLKLDPERAVAYLNLGDTFWDVGKKDKAKSSYLEYSKRVRPEKWPKYLKSRIN